MWLYVHGWYVIIITGSDNKITTSPAVRETFAMSTELMTLQMFRHYSSKEFFTNFKVYINVPFILLFTQLFNKKVLQL